MQHRILVASDGSPSAEAAIAAAIAFPWNASARARGVVADFPWLRTESAAAQAAVQNSVELVAHSAQQTLRRRWPTARVDLVDAPPTDAILGAAKAFKATVIAVGWRGHGTFRRLIAGSISRSVAANAHCSVLVVRQAPKAVRRILIGYDESPNARRALELIASLEAPRGGRVVLVDAVVPQVLPAAAQRLPSSLRSELRHQVQALNEERREAAEKLLHAGAARLRRTGWNVDVEVRSGAPVAAILAAAADHTADVVVVGARATSGLERLLLGSVANAVLNRSQAAVLLVR